jgi:DNA-binding NtrC family response regulator
VRQLRNLIESMVVLAPDHEIGPADIPQEIRDGRMRFLPMPLPDSRREIAGQELEFIFRSLVELKLQIEQMRRRIDEGVTPVEVIDLGRAPARSGVVAAPVYAPPPPEDEREVLYRPGMTMAEVERAAIEAALAETRGNRRKAADQLGIGERTLYRKIKEFGLS